MDILYNECKKFGGKPITKEYTDALTQGCKNKCLLTNTEQPEEQALSVTAKGMSTRDISDFIREM